MADRADRRAVARAHARRAHDADLAPELAGKIAEQVLGAAHRAGQRIAHPHRDRRRRRLAFLHHVEMRVEGRDLVDLGQRKLHLGGERGEMRGREMPVAVLDQMQMLDQEIAPALARAEQRANLGERGRVDLPALGRAARAAAAVAVRASAPFVLGFERVVVLIRSVSIGPRCRFSARRLNPLLPMQRLKFSIVGNSLGLSEA